MGFVGDDVELALLYRQGVACESGDVQMHGTRRTGRRFAERLAHQMLHLIERLDLGVREAAGTMGLRREIHVFCHRLFRRANCFHATSVLGLL